MNTMSPKLMGPNKMKPITKTPFPIEEFAFLLHCPWGCKPATLLLSSLCQCEKDTRGNEPTLA